MPNKTDIVSLKWVIGLMNKQLENAEAALVEYSNDASQKKSLLQCMWSVHQVTSTLRALGMKKGEMLSLEMERSLNHVYKDKVVGERRKLTMGGLMQAIKILPAYFAHTQNARQDTGRGLEQYVNDLRRWVGERPRPQAFFFHMEIPAHAGISTDRTPASSEEIKSRANVMLALYLEMAKSALRRRNVVESMKTVARISRKMQMLFVGTEPERFWFTLVGICEGVAGGIIVPDECIAQIFKTGAFLIKYARENGNEVDDSVDYEANLQQMLYYIAACKSKPVHIAAIRDVFDIDEDTIDAANRGLVHIDALVTALSGALEQLNQVVDLINSQDLLHAGLVGVELDEDGPLDGIEAAQHRLSAAGQVPHADSLQMVEGKLRQIYRGDFCDNQMAQEQAITDIVRGIIDVKLDLEHKLEHGLCSSFSSKEFELRESVISATFTQMSLVENYIHQILRRKALANALVRKPADDRGLLELTLALHRFLNKSDEGHEELRAALGEADRGEPDLDLLYDLACGYLDALDDIPERQAVSLSLQLLAEISGALTFANMEREGKVIELCREWLEAATKAGSVHEDDAFRCFADAFAQIEMHLQRSMIDPLDDTAYMITFAEQQAAQLHTFSKQLSQGSDVVDVSEESVPAQQSYVQDGQIPPEFRDVFIEESEEIVSELTTLLSGWSLDPKVDNRLRDMRRYFHTFKGNGRAVGANILGELGWATQDMLDLVLDGDLTLSPTVIGLLQEVVDALPALVTSYRKLEGLDVARVRGLTNRCFSMSRDGGEDLASELPDAKETTDTPAPGNPVVVSPEALRH